ncbi:MAG: DUF1211 domain-containing protein [Chloroflexi bacterium]|nr:MAG: DUF1211 domain-containing protein [Chloroflexota bacterium]
MSLESPNAATETGTGTDVANAMPRVAYNEIAGRNVERIAALSDGLFAIAMTLIVFEIRIPDTAGITTDQQLIDALVPLAPRFLTYLLSFLTLGIFWNGQQTQLNSMARANRDFAWLSLLFLATVALFPFTTSVLAEFFDLRLALGLYWLNIFATGMAILACWVYAKRANLLRDDQDHVDVAIRRRITTAQTLYAIGLAIGLVFGTLPAVVFIVVIQLNFAIAPRIWILHRI